MNGFSRYYIYPHRDNSRSKDTDVYGCSNIYIVDLGNFYFRLRLFF